MLSTSISIEKAALRFTLNTLKVEVSEQNKRFQRLDVLYSKFFYVQRSLVRDLVRFEGVSQEEKLRQWSLIDAQENEWQTCLDDWLYERFNLYQSISHLQELIRQLDVQGLEVRHAA
ncbi:MAG: hypothetical protein IPJ69_02010 [Deltaproteobacteria bacterium]|nr:MAG: hypothetical protein IPJ69_02010 [Deltaproteobacteria bacterium]